MSGAGLLECDPGLFCKLLMVGDCSVGKSRLLSVFTGYNNRTTQPYTPNVELEAETKTIMLDDVRFRMFIVNKPGLETFRSFLPTLYKNTNGVLIVYSVTSRDSFEKLDGVYLDQIRHYAKNDTSILLVGNKIDLEGKREVTTKEGLCFAKKHNIQFCETSQFDSLSVEKAFVILAAMVKRKYDEKDI